MRGLLRKDKDLVVALPAVGVIFGLFGSATPSLEHGLSVNG
jgi:hypothetical protein